MSKDISPQYTNKLQVHVRSLVLLLLILILPITTSCGENPASSTGDIAPTTSRNARLGLWLAKKGELIEHKSTA